MKPVTEKYTGKNLHFENIPFVADDGFTCNLIRVRGTKASDKGPVLLVHGAGVSASIFLAPVNKNIVEYLIEEGYDVWLENWRASIDFAPNKWTLDQAALYDHPAAVRKIVQITRSTSIKAIIHCQGSTSFMMSVVAGLVPQVNNVVSNAVSLHPIVPNFSRFKLKYMMPLVRQMTDYLNPQWGIKAPTFTAKMINTLVNLTHHECTNGVCKQVSFTYGSGFPALWRHENLNEETHEWIKDEFASVPMTFYKQMARSVAEGHLLPGDHPKELPATFVGKAPATQARISFFAGARNLCFLPESQTKTFNYFDKLRPGFHALRVLPDYSHLDIFIGRSAYKDVFPLMSQELSVN